MICLNQINNGAKIEKCEHEFCEKCIKEWATSNQNTCPICKQRFNSIILADSKTVHIPDKNLQNRKCEICTELVDDSEAQLICGFCNNYGHLKCIRSKKGLGCVIFDEH